MKKIDLFNGKKLSELETIEEKSFWIVAIVIILSGIVALLSGVSYETIVPSLIFVVLCLVIPIILIIVVVKTKQYHAAYPILCIAIGGFSIPLMFIVGGGFFSGMPMFCVVLTSLTALCYLQRWRYISLVLCMIGTTLAFIFVYNLGLDYIQPILSIRFPLVGTDDLYNNVDAINAVYNDIFFSYYCASGGLFAIINFTTSDIRRYKLNQDTLQRFFDIEKKNEILKKAKNKEGLANSNHEKVSIMFADISNFTSITEKMPSELITKFLNEFFSILGKHIHNTNGIIDKYIGDCIMAYWFDNKDTNCVLNAVTAMINAKNEIIKNSETIFEKYGSELNFSVGISYGDVIFGDIGSDSMHDYTVIGDAVNTASRIEGFAVSGEMLISKEAAKMVKGLVEVEIAENDHYFKGKNKPVDLYRVVGLADTNKDLQFVESNNYGYSLYVCGCRGSFPVSGLRFTEYGGETSCYVIRKDDYAVIVDCGTGLKNAIKLVEGCSKIDILLTHVHYDHILGFLMSTFPKGVDVKIYGVFDSWSTDSLRGFMQKPYWPIGLINTEKISVEVRKEIKLDKDIVATFYPSDHPDDACVIKVMIKDKKIVFLFDCEDANTIDADVPLNSDLLFFDGMFDDEDASIHKGWGHGTWQGGVRFEKGKNIKKFVITHHSPEFGDHSLKLKENKAREQSPNISFAKTGDIYII